LQIDKSIIWRGYNINLLFII